MSTFERKMKILDAVLRYFRRNSRISPAQLNFPQVESIVIINNKRLGDFLFCTPAIRALKDANPTAKITAVISSNNKGLITECPYINKVMYMDDSVISAIKTGRILRKSNPDLGIVFHSKNPYDFIAMTFAGVRCLLKHYFGNERKVLINSCDGYVLGGKLPPVKNDLVLVGKLDISIENKKMFYPSPVRQKAFNGRTVGIQLGASGIGRYFPTDTAANVVEKIARKYPDCVFHLLGAKAETHLSTDFFSNLDEGLKNRVVNHIGKTTLQELAELINNLSVLITPDTGCLHIATALQTKTVSLFVLKQPNASIPQQDPELHQVLYSSDYSNEEKCDNNISKLATIPANEIVERVTQALNQIP
ncbi:glycosyl transferase [Kosakonia radicincitans UMEnt01/12]|uniref:glycosyltransferase family 9 protein n=1 Tax=Kosakonia radicincitans TaxID=283686 RepID=UPI000461B0F4|nr:glycosyltransferase family 9 protein [Kosakonia radicincitans]KDE35159.1 glycosyl transferase [Kosakonia radicincitans UMEnt01/12]